MIRTRNEQDEIEQKLTILHLEIREYLWSLRDQGEAMAYLEQVQLAHARLKAICAEAEVEV